MAERLTAEEPEEMFDALAECEEAFRRHFGLLAPGRDWPVARMPTEEMLERAQHLWGPFRRGWCERGKHESAKLAVLQAENERLTATELTHEEWDQIIAYHSQERRRLIEECRASYGENERLREALRPFAEVASRPVSCWFYGGDTKEAISTASLPKRFFDRAAEVLGEPRGQSAASCLGLGGRIEELEAENAKLRKEVASLEASVRDAYDREWERTENTQH